MFVLWILEENFFPFFCLPFLMYDKKGEKKFDAIEFLVKNFCVLYSFSCFHALCMKGGEKVVHSQKGGEKV